MRYNDHIRFNKVRMIVEDEEEGMGCAPTGVMTLAVVTIFGLVSLVVGSVIVAAIVSAVAV